SWLRRWCRDIREHGEVVRMIQDIHQEILKSYRGKEQWRRVPNYDRYEVSSFGRVRNFWTGRVLKPGQQRHGYFAVRLARNNTTGPSIPIHRLVAKVFLGPIPNGKEVHHIDHNKQNNLVSNLRYVTHQENVRSCWENGRLSKKGSENSFSKLNESQVKEILTVKKFHGRNRQLAIKYCVDECTILDINKGRTWTHISGLPQWN